MKKTIALVTVLSVFVAGAFAGPQHKAAPKAKSKTPTEIACPVQGTKVNIAKATKNHMYADYKGNRYFFCCNGCPQEFKANPAKYANKPHIKTPAPAKKK